MEYTVKQLIDLLFITDEQERIEAKKASDVGKSVMETVCAYANEPALGGGYLLLGVEPDSSSHKKYNICGLPDPDRILSNLHTNCRTQFNVPLNSIRTKIEDVDGVRVAAVYVPEQQPSGKPVFFKSKGLPEGAWRRGPNGDYSCTESDLEELYQLRSLVDYDKTPCENADMGDIDPDAVARYRKERAEVNPDAEELQWEDNNLLLSLNALGKSGEKLVPTVAGIILFGKNSSLRRLFPMYRVDYIRIPGKEWVPDPDERFDTIDMRDSMFRLISRASAAVMDDLPNAFNLEEDKLQAKEKPLLPRKLVREAIVNALMHRNCRKSIPVQILRYANRLEIRNAGYSLKPEEQLGEPGSVPRNPAIAAVMHETDFAETKGSGIRTMQRLMKEADLSPPLFESDRSADMFTATYLFHHFLSPGDMQWLANFADCKLTNEDAMALIFVREADAIDNATLRHLTGVDSLTASQCLQKLRDVKLLIQKGKGRSTYYLPSEKFLAKSGLGSLGEELGPLSLKNGVGPLAPALGPLETELVSLDCLPDDLQELVSSMGKRSKQKKVRLVILALINWKSLSKEQIGELLKRNAKHFKRRHLNPMRDEGLLEYTFPEMPNHPKQAYQITEKGKKQLADKAFLENIKE